MIGETLGHYKIAAELGAGGMGQVYLAEDTELGRNVALKILPREFAADPDRLVRFKREARSLAAVNHPNIVSIYSVEESGGVNFLTMELVDGKTLSELIPRGGMPLEQIFKLAVPLADALAEAHEHGIVHRDLKPGNLMVTDRGRLKVLDFGLAKAAEASSAGNASELATEALTGEGTIVGTVPYMSPEQLEAKPLDARSDIFSLGIILYQMATGSRPFRGDTSVSLMSSILKDEPPEVTDSRADLPRHLGRIIRHCLEKKPEDRFQTARDVHNQFKALKLETTSSQSALPAAAATEPARGHRKAILAIAAVLIAVLVSYGAWRGGFGSRSTPAAAGPAISVPTAEKKPLIIVLPFENLGEPDDQYFADGMTEEVISRLAVLDDLAVISRSTAMQYRGNRPTAPELGRDLGVDYVLEGTVRWQRGAEGPSEVRITPTLIRVSDDTNLWAERYDAVLADIFAVQSDVAAQVSQQLGVALLVPQRRAIEARPTENMQAYDLFLKGNEYLNRGREVHSGDELRLALQMYDRATAADPTFALAYARAATAHGWLYGESADRTPERLNRAIETAQRALELEPDLPDAHYALGFALYAGDRRYDEALAEFETALAGQPGNADVYEAIARVQTSLGQWENGLSSLQRAMELDPRSGRLPCWSGGHCFGLRRFDEAKHYHDLAIERTPDRSCPYTCQVWIAMNRAGGTEYAREFLERLPPTLGLEESPPLAYPWVTLDMMEGRYEEALERLDSGEKPAYEFRVFYIPKDLLSGQIHAILGDEERAQRHYAAAVDHLEERIEHLALDARIRASLGIAYAGVGRKQDATREAEYAMTLLGDNQDEHLGYRIKDLAQTYLMVEEIDVALDHIETLVSIPTFFSTHYIEADPTFDLLHDNQRFQDLMKRYRPVEDRRQPHA